MAACSRRSSWAPAGAGRGTASQPAPAPTGLEDDDRNLFSYLGARALAPEEAHRPPGQADRGAPLNRQDLPRPDERGSFDQFQRDGLGTAESANQQASCGGQGEGHRQPEYRSLRTGALDHDLPAQTLDGLSDDGKAEPTTGDLVRLGPG